MSGEHDTLVTVIGTVGTALGGGLFGWLQGRRKVNAEATSTETAARLSAQAQMDSTTKFLLDELRKDREHCEKELNEARIEYKQDTAALRQELWSLETLVRNAGVPVPTRALPTIVYTPKPEEK